MAISFVEISVDGACTPVPIKMKMDDGDMKRLQARRGHIRRRNSRDFGTSQLTALRSNYIRSLLCGRGAEVCNWHETDMPRWSLDVRCWGQSGKHVLALSFSGFDPSETSVAPNEPVTEAASGVSVD